MIKKRILALTLIIALLLTFSLTFIVCTAESKIPIPTVKKDVFIYDDDNVIDDDIEQKLNKMLVELEEKTGAEFAVISIISLNDLTIEEYTNKVFNTLGIGKKGKDNGVLLLFSKADKRVRLEIGRGLEGCLPDGKCGAILDKYFVPYRDSNNYREATENTVQAVLNVISEEYSIQIEDLEEKDIPESDSVLPWWVWLIIIIIILIIIFADDSSSGSGYYRGSSGGSSFGSSFGGSFGGGFSGGGGASR